MQDSSTAISSGADMFTSNVTVNNTLQDAMKFNSSDLSSGTAGFTSSDSSKTTSIIPEKIDLSKENVTVFKAK